jgi:regulator of cell morphogenesis and NO signaling
MHASAITLYQALQDFESDLHQHIHLENNILFPHAVAMEAKR